MYKDGAIRDKPAVYNQLWAKEPMKAFLPEGYPHSVTADYASTHTDTRLVTALTAHCCC